jgi:hypothetical protein
MSEVKTGYMAELDAWSNKSIIEPLISTLIFDVVSGAKLIFFFTLMFPVILRLGRAQGRA